MRDMPIRKALRPAIIGPFGPAQLACLKSWSRLGLSPIFVRIEDNARAVRPAIRLAGYRRFTGKELATSAGLAAFLRFLETEQVSGVTCLADDLAIWLNGLRDVLPPGTKIWLPDNRVIDFLQSKSAQLALAREVGFAVLPTFRLGQSSDAPPEVGQFPLVARPDRPGAVAPSFKAEFIANQIGLGRFLSRFERISAPLVLQRFVDGPNLIVHGCRGRAGRFIDHVAFLAERKFEGVSLTIRPCPLDDALRQKCEAFCHKLDIVGCYHFDMIIDKTSGTAYFLELNGRFGGTTARALACGYDEPARLLAAHGEWDRRVLGYPASTRTCSNKLILAKYLLHIAAGRTTPLDYPPAPRWKRMLDVGLGMILWRDEILGFRNFRLAMSFYAQIFLDKLSAKRKTR